VKRVTLDGKPLPGVTVAHGELTGARLLRFELGT
jgi:hypothetical protein